MTFLNRDKTWGGTSDKNFCDETKILSGFWIGLWDGITGDFLIVIVYGFKTIQIIYDYIWIIYGKYNIYSLIYKYYIIEVFVHTCDHVQW